MILNRPTLTLNFVKTNLQYTYIRNTSQGNITEYKVATMVSSIDAGTKTTPPEEILIALKYNRSLSTLRIEKAEIALIGGVD